MAELIYRTKHSLRGYWNKEVAYREIVLDKPSWQDSALGHSGRTIHVGGTSLEQAVEMQAGGLIAQLVVDVDNQRIPYGALNGRNRPTTVDTNHRPWEAACWVGNNPSDIEVIHHSSSGYHGCQ